MRLRGGGSSPAVEGRPTRTVTAGQQTGGLRLTWRFACRRRCPRASSRSVIPA